MRIEVSFPTFIKKNTNFSEFQEFDQSKCIVSSLSRTMDFQFRHQTIIALKEMSKLGFNRMILIILSAFIRNALG